MMTKLSWSLLFLSLTWWIDQSNTTSSCSLRLTPRMQNVGITFNCGGQCSTVSSFGYSQCGLLFDELGIEQCIQAECNTRIYNLSIIREFINETTTSDMSIQSNAMDDVTNDMTTEKIQASTPTMVHRLEESTNRYVMDMCNYNTNQQPTAVAVLATMVAILIVLLVIVSTVLIWTCWTFNHKSQQHRIPNNLNATNTNQTARQLHNPVYGGNERPMGPSQTNQRLARDGKKAKNPYEVIPPTSPYKQHNSKQRGTATGQAKTRNNGSDVKTGRGKPMVASKLMVAGLGKTHNTSGDTDKASSGGYKGQLQYPIRVASTDDERNRYPLDKDRDKQDSHREENHYSQTGYFPKTNTTKKQENHYSRTRHFPKNNTPRKPDEGVNDHVYHALDMSGENNKAHKDQHARQNVYNILEGPGDNSDTERENEYYILEEPGDDNDTERENEYYVLEGPGDDNDTKEVQEVGNEYHVLEGSGDRSDTNTDVHEHKYHVLEGITSKQGEEGEEQG